MSPSVLGDWTPRTTPAPLVERYRAEGWWADDTLGSVLEADLTASADLPVRIWSDLRPHTATFGGLHEQARRLAAGLTARGIGPGDVVAFQLPNWAEAAVTFWGVAINGATLVPIVHFYGPKEVGYILRQSRARAFVTADRFGHLDYLANLDAIDVASVETIVVVGDDTGGHIAFADLLEDDPVRAPADVDPDTPAVVAYTSGTTADPKGVVHTHRTATAEMRQLGGMQPDHGRPTIVGAPVGHAIGMLAGLLLPVHRGDPVHLIDVWDPEKVLAAMLEADLTSGSGATFFLMSLLDHPACTPEHVARMRYVGLGGASVPAAVADRATERGISVVRAYGSTEHPSTTGATHDDPVAKRTHTDGRPLGGVEIRLVDETGCEVEAGSPGEVLSRGPDLFAGYTDAALTAETVDADGWYHSGDVGFVDEDGWLTITDRVKDVIIRGGENISPAEVEEQIIGITGVAEVAVVAAPDARLGEHACAFVRMVDPGSDTPTVEEVRAHLQEVGLARQKWPEDVRTVTEFPRTASGKIQKFVLRDQLRAE